MSGLVLFGANNPEVARLARAWQVVSGEPVLGFLDNDPAKQQGSFHGFALLGGLNAVSALAAQGARFVNVITRDCATRHTVTRQILQAGGTLGQFIHPEVNQLEVTLGLGSYIQQGALLQSAVRLGCNVSVSAGAIVNHETSLGDSCFVAPGANLCGKVTVAEGVFLGASCVVLPRLSIGAWAVIGAGAVVTSDVAPGQVMVGNPARCIGQRPCFEESLHD
ncbi:hypothetical protein [Atopomonas hussainii]|uniref:hypothetical protein n=1 Tax=Atopomonas hussainii TaxID=1429083 RepID=UPI0008FFEE6C|nr:hypothetical protein [Atopomonas hussainii]